MDFVVVKMTGQELLDLALAQEIMVWQPLPEWK